MHDNKNDIMGTRNTCNMVVKALIVAAATLLLLPTAVNAQTKGNYSKQTPLDKLKSAELAISNFYVDPVDEDKLVEDAIRGMLEKLDPHSSYTTPKETKEMNEPLEGSFEGIGVQYNLVEDTLLVIQPVVGGPSEKAGILAGDRIVTVNDTAIAGVKMTREKIMKRLRGPKGTKVCLGVVRRGISGVLKFTVKRARISVNSLDAAYIIRPGIGYVRFSKFGVTTHSEFVRAVDSLRQAGMKDLIIDLQENGGGYLDAAAKICNELLSKDDLIVYMQGRHCPRRDYRARGNGSFLNGKVAVLVNEYSASAAEILSGAVQDQDRGIVVGRRTFGKGLVQRPLTFNDGSMIRLTIAHYYTPSGRCIQKPYAKGESADYNMDIEKRFRHGELYSADSIHFADSLKYETLRKKRVVYGGGGIMPDYFVPLDTTQYSRLHRQLAAKSAIINACLKYTDNNRKQLAEQYKSFADFNASYEAPQQLIDMVLAEGEKQGVKPKDAEELAATLPTLRVQLKALVARDMWDMTQYFQVINENNRIVMKAVEVLSSGGAQT